MSRLKQLQECSNLNDIADLLGYKPKNLSYIIYKIPDNQKYSTFTIPKKSGGLRTIQSPHNRLKKVQSRLSDLLQDCTEELLPNEQRLKDKQSPHRANKAISHGFKKGLSIASNAAKHKQKKYVFNLDIEDFFKSINFGRVRGYFIKNKHFQLNKRVATIIAQIACHDNSLPQGSPCSPIISNLVGEVLDIRLLKLAKKYKCTYSRYADDLTLSTNKKDFPKEIGYKKNCKKSDWLVGKQLQDCLFRADFKINTTKTRMQYVGSRQVVTGLVVNKVVNTKSEYYRNARVMCHSLFMTGSFHIPQHKIKNKKRKFLIKRLATFIKNLLIPTPKVRGDTYNNDNEEKIKLGSIQQLEGILSYIYHIKNYRNKYAQDGYRQSRHDGIFQPPDHKKKDDDLPISKSYPPPNRCVQYTDESHKVSVDGIKNLYSKFLFFKHFCFLEKPLIICEGKTDNIYFQCALKKLNSKFPSLISKNKSKIKKNDPDFLYHINFLKKTETLHEMLKLAPGSSGLTYLMTGYARRMGKYRYTNKNYPVIMIVDNDEAGKNVIKRALTEYNCKEGEKFIFVTENLYILLLPEIGEGDTEPEKYFDDETKQLKFNGRSFNPDSSIKDPGQALSKASFAHDIIGRNWKNINFDKFKQVYDVIELIIVDYQKKSAVHQQK